MHYLSKHITLAFLAIVLLVVVSLACSPTGALPGGGTQGQPTAQATAAGDQPTAQPKPQATATGAQAVKPTATTASGAPLGGLPQLGDLKSLSSYRSTMTMKTKDDKGQDLISVITTEWVKDQKAEHIMMKDAAGKTTSEIITIGDKRWLWMPTLGWREMPPSPEKASDLPTDLESQVKKMQSDLSQAKPSFTLIGSETVNGVRCRHYKYDIVLSLDMPNLPTGGTQKVDIHSLGEMWIADQSGLPAIIIQTKETSEITLMGKKTVMDGERKVYDINAAITIKPPEGAAALPVGPTPAAGKTPTPTKSGAAAVPTATGARPTLPSQGAAGVLTVKGTDVIYLAGRSDIKIPPLGQEDENYPIVRCGGELVETFPISQAVKPGGTLNFKVTGGIAYWSGAELTGPDGVDQSDVEGLGGISRYYGPQGALVGVFLSNANPKDEAEPDWLDFSEAGLGTAFDNLAPALGQVFFIGDGLTGTGKGKAQAFGVPAGATRLFLGIADADSFVGAPGCYDDDKGVLQVVVSGTGRVQ